MPQDQVEEVKQKTDITSLIGEYVDLKKAGRNFKGLCPFHAEKTPSFMVSPELQIFKCFGCGESGDVYTFLEKHEGMDFYEALKFLAERAGVKLKPQMQKQRGERQRLYEVNNYISRFYNWVLLNHKSGKKALEYLQKQRGLKQETIDTFNLGYSPDKAFAMGKYILEKKKVDLEELDKVGVVYKRGRDVFDRFRGRVIFPLYDHRGNVIGFAGRILPSEKRKDLAKYINTPETKIYHKGSVLYGLNVTKGDIKRDQDAVIVEGELDLISSWQAGIKNVVATKGTALTPDQVRLLSRYTPKVTLALDADIAGDKAAKRGIAIAQNEGLEVKVARLKKYKDPDEAARKDADFYKKTLNDSVGIWDFLVDSIFSKYDIQKGEDKVKISKEIAPVLGSIEDKIVQSHYVKFVAEKLNVSEEAVAEQVFSVRSENEAPELAVEERKGSQKGRRQRLEERLLTLSFQSDPENVINGKIRKLIKTPLARRIVDEYESYRKGKKKFDASGFRKKLPKELEQGFSEMMLSDQAGLVDSPSELEKEVFQIKHALKKLDLEEKRKELTKKLKEAEKAKDSKQAQGLQEKLVKINEKYSELERENKAGIIME
jgi:DNA primase